MRDSAPYHFFYWVILGCLYQANIYCKPLPPAFERTIYYQLGETIVPIHTKQFGKENGITCINLHANEQTSVLAATTVLEKQGGFLIRIENGDERKIRFRLKGKSYSFDPNRMFSRIGIIESLKEDGEGSEPAIAEIENFAERVLDLIPGKTKCVVALHNNTEDAFSVLSYKTGGADETDAKKVYVNPGKDIDDFCYTTDKVIYDAMSAKGYNCILQHNDRARKDGSLSVLYGEKNKRYVNIETQHGKTGEYIEMLETLLEFLNK